MNWLYWWTSAKPRANPQHIFWLCARLMLAHGCHAVHFKIQCGDMQICASCEMPWFMWNRHSMDFWTNDCVQRQRHNARRRLASFRSLSLCLPFSSAASVLVTSRSMRLDHVLYISNRTSTLWHSIPAYMVSPIYVLNIQCRLVTECNYDCIGWHMRRETVPLAWLLNNSTTNWIKVFVYLVGFNKWYIYIRDIRIEHSAHTLTNMCIHLTG